MADNITAPGVGVVLGSEDIGGVQYPIAKTAFGADGAVVLVADANGARLPVQIGGTLPAFAATPTVALDAPTLAALESITAVGPLTNTELRAAAVPVTVQAVATTTRDYTFASGQRITTAGAGQVRSTAVAAAEVLLHASVRGFYRVGDSAVVATVGAGSIPLEAGEKFHQRITSGQFVSFIRDGATDGSLTIMPVA